MPTGTALLAHQKTLLAREGVTVSVIRRATAQGAAPTTASQVCLAQPIDPSSYSQLGIEGVMNLGEGGAHRFIFAGDADVREAVDSVVFDGMTYDLSRIANPPHVRGVRVARHFLGTRVQGTQS